MKFGIYKRGQGKYTRLGSAFGAAIIAGLGCFQLYNKLQAADVGLWVQTMVPASLFVVLSFLIFWFVNKPNIANFMIAAEAEMKKVSWSTRKEVIRSTKVVIFSVVMLGAFLFLADIMFMLFFSTIKVLKGPGLERLFGSGS